MLLAPHILVGAAIAANTPNPLLGLVFAFFSHFILDSIPHWEYSVEPLRQIRVRGIKYCLPIIRRVAADFGAGYFALIIAVLISNKDIPFGVWAFGGFFGALPDGLTFLTFLLKKGGVMPRLLGIIHSVHQKIHFDKEKGLPPLRITLSTQAIAILLALYFIIF